MGKRCDIYGPDPAIAQSQADAIYDAGMKCMKGTGGTSKPESSTGKDASDSELSHLLPEKE